MGLNISQIFLRRFNFTAFMKSAGPAWSRNIAGDKEPRLRQLLVLFRQPWIVLIDSTGMIDKALALEISRATEGEAIWYSLVGTMLSLETSRFVNGETVDHRKLPADEADGVMPLYVDAEHEAWNALKKWDVPPELRLLRGRDISAQATKGEPGDLVMIERKAPGAEPGHAYFHFQVKSPRKEEQGPPVEYSLYKAEDRFLSDLYVATVTRDAERVDHLLGVLDHIARRKIRPPDHTYQVFVTPYTKDEGEIATARSILKERYQALSKMRPFAFKI